MTSKIIGVEIGSDTVKLALCMGGSCKSIAVSRMPDNLVREGRVTAPAAMTEFLQQMLKDHGLRGGACALVLPPQIMLSHKVVMPVMSEQELMLNLPFEFRDFVGKEGDKYTYDYAILNVKENVMELYAAACPTDVVEEYYEILRRAGLKMKAAMPPEMAWLNIIRRAERVPARLCIVDAGHYYTRVNIFRDGRFEMGKEIGMGGAALNDIIASKQSVDPYVARTNKESNLLNVLCEDFCDDFYSDLAVEVMKIINYYAFSTEGGTKLQDVYFCGGSAQISNLRTAIAKSTGLTTHTIDWLISDESENNESVMYGALAAGAAMQLQ